jgi:hypothetical protein
MLQAVKIFGSISPPKPHTFASSPLQSRPNLILDEVWKLKSEMGEFKQAFNQEKN